MRCIETVEFLHIPSVARKIKSNMRCIETKTTLKNLVAIIDKE